MQRARMTAREVLSMACLLTNLRKIPLQTGKVLITKSGEK